MKLVKRQKRSGVFNADLSKHRKFKLDSRAWSKFLRELDLSSRSDDKLLDVDDVDCLFNYCMDNTDLSIKSKEIFRTKWLEMKEKL